MPATSTLLQIGLRLMTAAALLRFHRGAGGDLTGVAQGDHRGRAGTGGTVGSTHTWRSPMTTIVLLLAFFALLSVADLLPSTVR